MVFVTQLVCWRPRSIIFLLWQLRTHPSNEALLDHQGANGHCPDLHLLQQLSAFLSSILTWRLPFFFFFFSQRTSIFLLGRSSVLSHFEKALSLVGPEPTRLRIRGLRPGQRTARTYQGPPAGVLPPCRVAVLLSLKEVKQAKPLCFSASLANKSKRQRGEENSRMNKIDNTFLSFWQYLKDCCLVWLTHFLITYTSILKNFNC